MTTLTATQADITKPPVRLVLTGLPVANQPGVFSGIIQRTANAGVTWDTVRGAIDLDNDVEAGHIADDMSVAGSSGWGVTSTGAAAWAVVEGTAANFSKASGTARVSMSALNTNHSIEVDTGSTDHDATIYVTMPALITGASGAAIVDLRARSSATLVHYRLRAVFNTSGAIDITLTRSLTAGTTTLGTLASASTLVAGHTYGMRISAVGNRIQGMLWDTAGATPTDFQLAATNQDITHGTKIRVFAFLNSSVTNSLPYVFAFDNFAALIPAETIDDYEFQPGALNTYRAGLMQEFADPFDGTASSSWGTAPTGQAWALANAAVNKAAGVGTILHAADDTAFLQTISGMTDVGDARVSFAIAAPAASTINDNNAEWTSIARYLDGDNRYETNVRVNAFDGQSMTLTFSVMFEGIRTALDSVTLPFVYAGSSRYRCETWLVGQRVRCRVWRPAVEPAPDWQIDEIVTAGMRIASGGVGVETYRYASNSNSNLTFEIDDFVVDTGTPTFLSGVTDDLTPDLAGVWVCSTLRSFLNSAPLIIAYEEPSRGGRGGAVGVAGRTLPIGLAEVMESRSWTVTFRATSLASARKLEYLLASGDVLFLQTPADCPIPRGYYRAARMESKRVTPRSDKRLFEVPLGEVAAPGPDVGTSANTWDSVFLQYGSWEQVLALGLPWEVLRDTLIGDPSEVVIP